MPNIYGGWRVIAVYIIKLGGGKCIRLKPDTTLSAQILEGKVLFVCTGSEYNEATPNDMGPVTEIRMWLSHDDYVRLFGKMYPALQRL